MSNLSKHIFTAVLFILFTLLHINTHAQKIVYEFSIDQEIGPSMSKLTEKAMTTAKEAKADYILLILDTYGGALEDGDKIRTMFLKSEIPTLVYIKNNAASAGALISIACDSIYMSEGGTIGAASVVNQTGELMPEKYQSYMRKKMRATAEGTGRNPLIAEGMADENLVIDGVKESGKIVSLTTDEAITQGYCNAKVKSVDDILRRLGDGYTIKRHEITATDNVVLFFLNPAVSGLLLMIIFGGIFMEFKAPGSIFPIAIAGVAAVFYFVPLYLEGLADNWEIVIFFLGIILLLLEIFIIPGFGVAGITGIIFIIGGLALAMVRNVLFDFTFVPKGAFSSAVFLVAVSIAIPVVLILVFGKRIFESKALSWSAVKPDLKANEGFTVKESILDSFIGMKAICHTDLRPQGKIEIGGEFYEANADGEFIEKGKEVIVKGVRNNYLVVHRV